MAGLRAHGDSITGCSSANNLQRQIGLVAMYTDKYAAVDLIMPNGQIRMIGVDLDFRVDLWILGTIVGHGDQHRFLVGLNAFLERIKKMSNGRRFLCGLFVPCPQHEGTRENCRHLCH